MDPRLALAIEISKEAGELTLRYFNQPGLAFERKADDSPVTVADKEAEKLLRERITAAFPDDAIVGEEFPVKEGIGFRWILDPIDGTKSFITGVPLYTTLIGIQNIGDGDEPEIGVIHAPALRETVYAQRGQGAWHVIGDAEPTQARVGDFKSIQDGVFLTSQVDAFAERGAAEAYLEIERRAYVTRTWGDAYGYMLVATGRAALMVDPELNLWDAAAVYPILREAGGVFTDWKGEPTVHHREGIGTTPALLDEVVAITGPYPNPLL